MSTPKHNGHDPNGHFHEDSIREGYEVTDASVGGIVVFLVSHDRTVKVIGRLI